MSEVGIWVSLHAAGGAEGGYPGYERQQLGREDGRGFLWFPRSHAGDGPLLECYALWDAPAGGRLLLADRFEPAVRAGDGVSPGIAVPAWERARAEAESRAGGAG